MGQVWRGVAASCALTAAVLAGAVLATPDSAAGTTPLLPDLREAPPGCHEGSMPTIPCGDWDVCVVEDPRSPSGPCVRSGRAARIRFTSAVDNVGDGPLLVYGRRADTQTPTMAVRQAFQTPDSGPIPASFAEAQHPTDGAMYYEPTQSHEHWHYLDFEHFELRSPAGQTLVKDRKNGFCLGDRYPAFDSYQLPDAVRPNTPQGDLAEFLAGNNCKHHQPGALEATEGISVGRGDHYKLDVDYQWLDITDVPSGTYDLVGTANPDRRLQETRYDNNSSSIAISIKWNKKANGTVPEAPDVRLIKACPGAARCATK